MVPHPSDPWSFVPPAATATAEAVVIVAVHTEVPGVKTFTIAYPGGGDIPFDSGQFITLVFYHHGREERRSYSITSVSGEPLSFTVKRLENGACSRLLADKAAPGDTLYTAGVSGLFVLPDQPDEYEQFFFFAAGIGITPVYSLIRTLLQTQPQKKVVLIYSNSRRENVVFYDALADLAARHPGNFRLEHLLSNTYDLARARLSKELLPVLVREYAVCPPGKIVFYLCGPFAYMRMAVFALQEMHFSAAQIRRESFNTTNRVKITVDPPDKATRMATLRSAQGEWSFPVVYPDSILAAAKKQHIILPYSCEVGRCGSCAALCTKGEVWLSYNEVLMDSELKKGKILTCVGHPVGGDVVVEI